MCIEFLKILTQEENIAVELLNNVTEDDTDTLLVARKRGLDGDLRLYVVSEERADGWKITQQ